ncbi:MAG: endonuclease III [Anaerolineaceae bacterium]|nr:endonuclease III [Anaerolineaceae bacterium]
MEGHDALREQARQIFERLMMEFGEPDWRTLPPLDELVSTILSQNTNDRNRDIAYHTLTQRFPGWEDVRDADEEDVIDAVRIAGLANQKGPRIQAILKLITREHGDLNLDFLRSMPADEVFDWLVSLNGVGPKTASIVMLFSLGIPAFPVDTHIYRVSGRTGLRPEKMSVEQAHEHLRSLFDPKDYGPAHINLIYLGRRICHARTPNCDECPIIEYCEYGQNQRK